MTSLPATLADHRTTRPYHMDRFALAWNAWCRVKLNLEAAVDAGTMSAQDALAAFDRYRAAYRRRRNALKFEAFMTAHGHGDVLADNWRTKFYGDNRTERKLERLSAETSRERAA